MGSTKKQKNINLLFGGKEYEMQFVVPPGESGYRLNRTTIGGEKLEVEK